MEAQIPQTATIKRNEAKIEVTCDGAPKFEIRDIDVEYVRTRAVLKIKGKYYACHQAVWFISDSPPAPGLFQTTVHRRWIPFLRTARFINVICPCLRLNTETVNVGYTPGYAGTYVNDWHRSLWHRL
jgi:hypothetical protein